MIRIEIELRDGVLHSLDTRGHDRARGSQGSIVCASVTALVRSAAKSLEQNTSLRIEGSAEKPGSLYVRIAGYRQESLEWLRGVTSMLITGVKDLEGEFPRKIVLHVREV